MEIVITKAIFEAAYDEWRDSLVGYDGIYETPIYGDELFKEILRQKEVLKTPLDAQ